MPEKPKEKPDCDRQKEDASDEGSWGEDQKERSYYYDDAHGYDVYVPDEDEKEEKEF